MAATAIIGTVENIPEMIRLLRQIDPELRKEAAKRIRAIGRTVAADAKAQIGDVPLSGWQHQGRTGFIPSRVRQGISVKTKFTAKRTQNEIPLMTLRQRSPAGEILDYAGRRSSGDTPQGAAMIRNLNARRGRPSRYMWPTMERNIGRVTSELEAAAADMARTINERAPK